MIFQRKKYLPLMMDKHNWVYAVALKKSVEFFFKNKRIQGPTYVKFATG
jgi:hypothetical protein